MQVITTIKEDASEGLMSLIGQRVTFFSMNYIYTGDLVGVNDVQVKLDNPAIVYETGAFSDPKWKDAQALPKSIYVRVSAVEAYGVVK
jgi:hypothetical protein